MSKQIPKVIIALIFCGLVVTAAMVFAEGPAAPGRLERSPAAGGRVHLDRYHPYPHRPPGQPDHPGAEAHEQARADPGGPGVPEEALE